MFKKLICILSAALILSVSAVPASADQKSTAVNKEIVFVDGFMDNSYASSGMITVDQIVKQNGTSDTTAEIYILYDNTYIYIFGSVKDKTRVNTQPEHDWTTDSVEIQLDLDCYDAGETVGTGYTGLFRVVRYTGGVSVAETSTSPFFTAVKDDILCSVFDKGEDGYDFELAVPHLNGFRGAKLGVSCIVNDANNEVDNLAAMIFMNAANTGSYNNTKDFYTFTLTSFSNARSANAPSYVSSAVSSGTSSGDPSDPSSEESSDTQQSSDTAASDGQSQTELPDPTDNGGINPIIICCVVGAAALIIIIVSAAVAKKKKNKAKKEEK